MKSHSVKLLYLTMNDKQFVKIQNVGGGTELTFNQRTFTQLIA